MLTTPRWTGGLVVIAMSLASVATQSWTSPRVVEAAALGYGSLARLVVGYGCLWFLVGAAFGLPAVLGWVVTYRPQRPTP